MSVVAVSWLALELATTHREMWVAAAAAAYTLPAAAGALLLGRFLRDRSPSRLIGWDAALRATMLGAIPVVFAYGGLRIELYVALLAFSSVLHSWGQAGIYSLVAKSLSERDHLAGNALVSVLGATTTIIGPTVAAVLIAWNGPASVLAFTAATYVALSLTALLAIEAAPSQFSDQSPRMHGSGFAVVRRNPSLAGILVISALFFLLFGTVYTALPLYVKGELQANASVLAMFYTAFGAGAVFGGILAGYLGRLRLWPTAIGVVLGVGVALLPVGFGMPVPISVASFAAIGALWPPYVSLVTTLIQRIATGPELTSVLAANSSVRVMSIPLGTAVAGPLTAWLGSEGTLRLAAILIVAIGVGAALVVLSRRSVGSSR